MEFIPSIYSGQALSVAEWVELLKLSDNPEIKMVQDTVALLLAYAGTEKQQKTQQTFLSSCKKAVQP
jgi:hypothetical protein